MNTSRRVRHEIADAIAVAGVSCALSVLCASLVWLAIWMVGA